MKKASQLVEINFNNHLETLRRCGGYYNCPKDAEGKRLGPLVGYAGKYLDASGQKKQFVGDEYYNFAKAEVYPHVIDYFSKVLASYIMQVFDEVDYILGAPMGGITIAKELSRHLDCRFVFAEKKIIALATESGREESILVLNRHEIESSSKVLVCEDVCNNFSTTEKTEKLIKDSGSEMIGITCELNRSNQTSWNGRPVVPLLYIPTAQYKQDDPEVAADIANVVWKPKDQWVRLTVAMGG